MRVQQRGRRRVLTSAGSGTRVQRCAVPGPRTRNLHVGGAVCAHAHGSVGPLGEEVDRPRGLRH